MPSLAGKPWSAWVKLGNKISRGSLNATHVVGQAFPSCWPACSTDKRWVRAFSSTTIPSDQVTTFTFLTLSFTTDHPLPTTSLHGSVLPPTILLLLPSSALSCEPGCHIHVPALKVLRGVGPWQVYLTSLCPSFLVCKMEVLSRADLAGVLRGWNLPVSTASSAQGTEQVLCTCRLYSSPFISLGQHSSGFFQPPSRTSSFHLPVPSTHHRAS